MEMNFILHLFNYNHILEKKMGSSIQIIEGNKTFKHIFKVLGLFFLFMPLARRFSLKSEIQAIEIKGQYSKKKRST